MLYFPHHIYIYYEENLVTVPDSYDHLCSDFKYWEEENDQFSHKYETIHPHNKT